MTKNVADSLAGASKQSKEIFEHLRDVLLYDLESPSNIQNRNLMIDYKAQRHSLRRNNG